MRYHLRSKVEVQRELDHIKHEQDHSRQYFTSEAEWQSVVDASAFQEYLNERLCEEGLHFVSETQYGFVFHSKD